MTAPQIAPLSPGLALLLTSGQSYFLLVSSHYIFPRNCECDPPFCFFGFLAYPFWCKSLSWKPFWLLSCACLCFSLFNLLSGVQLWNSKLSLLPVACLSLSIGCCSSHSAPNSWVVWIAWCLSDFWVDAVWPWRFSFFAVNFAGQVCSFSWWPHSLRWVLSSFPMKSPGRELLSPVTNEHWCKEVEFLSCGFIFLQCLIYARIWKIPGAWCLIINFFFPSMTCFSKSFSGLAFFMS